MRRLLIGLAALAAMVSFSGVALVARAEGPVKCEITKDGKTETKHVKKAADCTKMGGKVVAEKSQSDKPKM